MKNGSDTSRTQLHLSKDASLAESRRASLRLKWMDHFKKYRNARLTCRHFGISPDTFYRWQQRYHPKNLQTLDDNKKSRRPHKLRTSKHLTDQLETIRKLRDVNPKIGKTNIARILKETGAALSPSTVSRILKTLKRET